jgi:hypothetical protein
MFRREIHRAMAPILAALDPNVLTNAGFALGGATRIALALGEVRESADLDFVGSSTTGYASLRARVRNEGAASLLRPGAALDVAREPTADQYGIRFPVRTGGRDVKVELIVETRIQLEAPVREAFSDLPCLSERDCYAEKLLACSDRGGDASTLFRDVVDLAVLRERWGPIPEAAWELAIGAYGASVRRDLERVLQRFRSDDTARARAFAGLRVDDAPLVLSGVEALASDLGLPLPDVE